MGIKSWIRNMLAEPEQVGEDFVPVEQDRPSAKVLVKTFQLQSFDDTKTVLATLREGNVISLVDMGPLREKDVIDLKRSISKLKNACAELGADIASLGGDWIIVTPGFAEIYKPQMAAPQAPAGNTIPQEFSRVMPY